MEHGQQGGVLLLQGLQLTGQACGALPGFCGGLGIGSRLLAQLRMGQLCSFGLGLQLHQLRPGGVCSRMGGYDLGGGLFAGLAGLFAQAVGIGVRTVQLGAQIRGAVLDFSDAGACLVCPAGGVNQLLTTAASSSACIPAAAFSAASAATAVSSSIAWRSNASASSWRMASSSPQLDLPGRLRVAQRFIRQLLGLQPDGGHGSGAGLLHGVGHCDHHGRGLGGLRSAPLLDHGAGSVLRSQPAAAKAWSNVCLYFQQGRGSTGAAEKSSCRNTAKGV